MAWLALENPALVSPLVGYRMFHRITRFTLAVVVTLLASMIAYVWGMAVALSWPLSTPNIEYALGAGAFWGVVGGLLVGLLTAAAPPNWRSVAWYIGLGSLLWAAITGFCFFVFVAGVASC